MNRIGTIALITLKIIGLVLLTTAKILWGVLVTLVKILNFLGQHEANKKAAKKANKTHLNRANGVAQNIALGGPLSPLGMVNLVRRGSKNRHIETMVELRKRDPK
jgi:hypothetical protein